MLMATCCLKLYEVRPAILRLMTSSVDKSPTNLNLSSTERKSLLLLDWESYPSKPTLDPCGPPPGKSLTVDIWFCHFTEPNQLDEILEHLCTI